MNLKVAHFSKKPILVINSKESGAQTIKTISSQRIAYIIYQKWENTSTYSNARFVLTWPKNLDHATNAKPSFANTVLSTHWLTMIAVLNVIKKILIFHRLSQGMYCHFSTKWKSLARIKMLVVKKFSPMKLLKTMNNSVHTVKTVNYYSRNVINIIKRLK